MDLCVFVRADKHTSVHDALPHSNVEHDGVRPNVDDGGQPNVDEPHGSNGEVKSRSRKGCRIESEWGRMYGKSHETKGWST